MTKTSLSDREELRCIGCGAVIQTTDKIEAGYTPASALEKGIEDEEIYCQRCFRLRHYNDIQDVSLTDDDFLNFLGFGENNCGEEIIQRRKGIIQYDGNDGLCTQVINIHNSDIVGRFKVKMGNKEYDTRK